MISGSDVAGKWALVTGASNGIGVDVARELAARRCHLILAARRREPMEELADELSSQHGVEVDVINMDLATPEAADQLHAQVAESGREVSVLVNNAGFGMHGRFVEQSWDALIGMLVLNIATLTRLTHLFAPEMVVRGYGRIMQVSSMLGFHAAPTYAVYSASKAYVLQFSEALNHELHGTGVSSTALCPGVTGTEFLYVAGQEATWAQRLMMMRSADVARVGVRAMLRRRKAVVPGLLNKISAFSYRLVPRRTATRVLSWVMSN